MGEQDLLTVATIASLRGAAVRKEELLAAVARGQSREDAAPALRRLENEAIVMLEELLEGSGEDFELLRRVVKQAGADWLFAAMFDRAVDVASVETGELRRGGGD